MNKRQSVADGSGIGHMPGVNLYVCECGAGHDWKTAWSLAKFHHLIMYKKVLNKFIGKVIYFI